MVRSPLPVRTLAASVSAVAVAGLAASVRADVVLDFEKIALAGETAPGSAGLYQSFDQPTINASGQVAFYGAFNDGTLTNAIWTTGPTGLGDGMFMAARVGGAAPGTGVPDLNFAGFGGARVGLSDTGSIIFTGTIAGTTADLDRGIWMGNLATTGIQLLVREGDAAALGGHPSNQSPFDEANTQTPVYNFNLGLAVIGKSGIGGFTSPITLDVDNALNEPSLFGGTPGAANLLTLAGSQVLNETAGVLYQGVATTPRLNISGQSAFAASLKGGATGTAIFVGAPGNAVVLAAQGRAAPGFGTGTFDAVQFPDLNDNGDVAFVAAVNGFESDTNPFLGEAIYFGPAGGISPVVRIGDTATDLAGDTYSEFVNTFGPMINDANQIAFVALVEGATTTANNNLVVMAGDVTDAANLRVAAREGVTLDQDGAAFPTGASLNDSPLINNAGDVAFHITEGDGSTSLWLAYRTGELLRLVGSGDLFTVAEGDIRTVTALKMGTNIDGYQYLSENGSVVFGLLFDNGTEGVFASSIAIPEPAGLALALAAGGLLLRRRRA